MLVVETITMLRLAHRDGKPIKAIPRDLRLPRNTVPGRLSGVIAIRRSKNLLSSSNDRDSSAALNRSEIAMARTALGPHFTARLRASCATTAYAKRISANCPLPRRPAQVAMSTTEPPPPVAICGSAGLQRTT